MSEFTGNIGREEEDGLGWSGMVESPSEKRARTSGEELCAKHAEIMAKSMMAAALPAIMA